MIAAYLAIAITLFTLIFFNRKKRINRLYVILFLLIQWIFTIYEFSHKNIVEMAFFKPDAIALLLLGALGIISIPVLFHSYEYIYKESEDASTRASYYSSMVLLITAITAVYLTSHIAVTWIFIEITTLSASFLIYHRRNSGSLEATWKYIFVCSVSLTFVFIGILFLGIAMDSKDEGGLHYAYLIQNAHSFNPFWMKLAFIFMFTGFTAKLGLVPMYTAGIDAKDKAPTPAAALFSSALMNVGFIGVYRIYALISHTSLHSWANHVMIIAACLSIFVATVYMLKVKNIKRMLAYSSIEHMGLVILGLVSGGIGYYAAILHAILHSFAKSSLFLQIGHVYSIYKSKNVYNMGNYFKYNTGGAVFLLLAFIIVTAMPPSGLFVSEFLIFKSLFEAQYLYILIPVLIFLTFIIWSFGKNIFKILFTPPVNFDESNIEKSSQIELISQYILLSMVIYMGLCPPAGFVKLIQEAVSNLM
jgi:hydrogenase-4 component F